MARTTLADLLVKIKADSTEFQKGIRQVQRDATKLSSDLTSVGSVFAGVGLAGVGAFAAISREAVVFESAFAGVKKTIEGTPQQFADLEKEFRKLATQIPVSVTELAKIGEVAGQLGIKRQDVIAFTETIAKLGVSSNLAGEEGATMLARFANITGVNAGEYENLASAIIDLGNNSATTERDIGELGLRLAGAGSAAGIAAPSLLGMAAALSSVGVNAEAGGTAFSKLIIDIQAAVETGSDDLVRFAAIAGTSAEEFAAAFRQDGAQAINQFIQGLDRIQASGGSVVAALESVGISEARMRDAILRSTQAAGDFSTSLDRANTAFREGSALQTEAAQRFGTTESQLVLLGNQIREIALAVGPQLVQVLRDIVESVRPVILAVGEWVAENPKLAAQIATVAAGVSALALAGGTLSVAFGSILGTLTPLIPILLKMGSALGSMSTAAAAAAGAAGTLKGAVAALGTAASGPFGIAIAAAAALGASFLILKDRHQQLEQSFAQTRNAATYAAELKKLGVEVERLEGESFVQFEARLRRTLQELSAAEKGTVVTTDRLKELNRTVGQAGQSVKITADELEQFGIKTDGVKSKVSVLRPVLDATKDATQTLTDAVESGGRAFNRFSVGSSPLQLDQFTQAQNRATEALQFFQNQAPQFSASVSSLTQTISDFGTANDQAALQVGNLGRIAAEAAAAQNEQARTTLESAGAFEKLDTAVQKPKTSISELGMIGRQVSTVFTDFGKDIARLIVDGGSLGDVFDSLKESLIRLAAEQGIGLLIKQLGKLIDLVPGLSSIKDVLGGIFGAAGGAASAAGGVAGGVGTAAGAAGSGASAAGSAASAAGSGVAGIVTAVSGVVTAVSSIIGNFQAARQEKTLNAIEENTRRGTLFLGDRGDGGILGQLFKANEILSFGAFVKAIEQSRDFLQAHLGPIEWTAKAIETKLDTWGEHIAKLTSIDTNLAALATGGGFGAQVTVQVAGSVVAEQDLVTLVANELDRRAAVVG